MTLWHVGPQSDPTDLDGCGEQFVASMVCTPAGNAAEVALRLVSLEVFGQVKWVYPDGADQLFDAEVAAMLSILERPGGTPTRRHTFSRVRPHGP